MKEHIAKGVRDHHFRNPVALAMQEYDPFAVVTKDFVHTRDRVYVLPSHIRTWLKCFNAKFSSPPVSFIL